MERQTPPSWIELIYLFIFLRRRKNRTPVGKPATQENIHDNIIEEENKRFKNFPEFLCHEEETSSAAEVQTRQNTKSPLELGDNLPY